MALHIGLVHAVESVVVEHGIHLRLARIVACAHGVDIGLLHECHVAQHGGYVDGVAVERVYVLGVDTFEEHALAVDKHLLAVVYAYVAESVFRGEHHFFVAAALLLHYHGVEVGILAAPRCECGNVPEV